MTRFDPWKYFRTYSPLPEAVEGDPDLSPVDKLLYAILYRYSQSRQEWPSIPMLARFLGISVCWTKRSLRSLKEAHYLQVFHEPPAGNDYKLLIKSKRQSIIPDEIMDQPIPPGAKLLYGRMLRVAGKKEKLWPTVDQLAAGIGCSSQVTRRLLHQLEKFKLIEIAKDAHNCGPNTYYFLHHKSFRLSPAQALAKEEVRKKLAEKYSLKLIKN